MIIRDAVEADLPAIVEIYNAAIRGRISTAQLDPVSVAERLPWFRAHSPESHPLWVADGDGPIAAWLSFHPFITRCAYRSTAEISVYVSEKFRCPHHFSSVGPGHRIPGWNRSRKCDDEQTKSAFAEFVAGELRKAGASEEEVRDYEDADPSFMVLIAAIRYRRKHSSGRTVPGWPFGFKLPRSMRSDRGD